MILIIGFPDFLEVDGSQYVCIVFIVRFMLLGMCIINAVPYLDYFHTVKSVWVPKNSAQIFKNFTIFFVLTLITLIIVLYFYL